TGTIGQPSAGTNSTGGQYSVVGGFWQPESDVATPTPTATPTATSTPTPTATPTPTPTPNPCVGCSLQFSNSNYIVDEGAGFATISVTRTGDVNGTVTVDYLTSDVGALQRFDYTIGAGTVTLGPGETSKSFLVLIVDDLYIESSESLNLTLSNPTGGALL